MLAVMRPNSSKAAEFISSWMALGSSGIAILAVGAFSVLNPNRSPPCSEMRAKPSHRVLVLPGALHQLLAAKFVP